MPGGPTDPDLGQINYAAWRAAQPGGGTTLPTWSQLSAAAQQAWIAGAVAVKRALGA